MKISIEMDITHLYTYDDGKVYLASMIGDGDTILSEGGDIHCAEDISMLPLDETIKCLARHGIVKDLRKEGE